MSSRVNKIIYIAFLSIVLILLIEAGYYFWQTKKLRPSSQEQVEKAGYKIVYQEDLKDTTGRTIFYQDRGEKLFNGSGTFSIYSSGIEDFHYFIGAFVRWEEIPGSKDKYLILKDPVSQNLLPKVRVAFQESELFEGKEWATTLDVEDLNFGPLFQTISKKGYLGRLMDWQEEDLEKIITPDDVVVALFWRKIGEIRERTERGIIYETVGGAVRDEKGALAARALYIRRFGGKAQIEKELGRKIEVL